MAVYNDDEDPKNGEASAQQDDDASSDSVSGHDRFTAGDTQLDCYSRGKASLKESQLKVLLEITASKNVEARLPLDLVAVLDVSESMEMNRAHGHGHGHGHKKSATTGDSKLETLKKAMQFVIGKLGPTDRLSVITFNSITKKLFPLRLLNEKSQAEIIEKILEIKAIGQTDTAAGLEEGLKVLGGRRFTDNRTAAIMLMSDGDRTHGFRDPILVHHIDQFPVHTFAFGKESTPKELEEIAAKSKGGTYTDVREEKHLSSAFAVCLAGLLSVVVQNLKLTIKPLEPDHGKIERVSAGKYYDVKEVKDAEKSIEISFGNLYSEEVRKILVYIRLSAIDNASNPKVLEASIAYQSQPETSDDATSFEGLPVTISVERSKTATDDDIPKVIIEDKRAQTIDFVEEARKLAKNRKYSDATKKLKEAKRSLEEVKNIEDPKKIIKALLVEVENLLRVVELDKDHGTSLMATFLSSQNMQRGVKGYLLHATPLMHEFVTNLLPSNAPI